MARTLRYLFVLLFVSVAGAAFAQSGGEIKGTITDEKNEPVIGAIVQVLQGGILKGGNATDADGQYSIKPLAPGRYDVKVSFASYKTSMTQNVVVSADATTEVSKKLEVNQNELDEVVVVQYKVPLVDKFKPAGSQTMTSEQIEKMPTRTTDGVASTSAGVYQNPNGGLSMTGGREEGTLYIVDGVQLRGSVGKNVPQNMIDQIQVLTSGVPAKYGDALGGVINITTKGITNKLQGNVLLEHSVDGYNHNLGNFTLLGPLYSKKEDGVKKPVIGFVLGVDAIYDEDRRPVYGGVYKVNDGLLAQMQANPLIAVPTVTGATAFRYASEKVRKEDLELIKKRQDAEVFEGRFNGKLDFQLAENLNLTVGARMNYAKARSYQAGVMDTYYPWSLYASEAIPTDISYSPGGFVRLTQRFGKTAVGPDEKKPVISNAYYSVQFDYQKDYFRRQNSDHKQDVFKYGYVGKFITDYATTYAPGTDDSTGVLGVKLMSDHTATGTRYERSDMNPLLANYTSQYYNMTPNTPASIDEIRFNRGLANGDLPPNIYGGGFSSFGWNNVGSTMGIYQLRDNDQFSVSVDAAFDLQPGKTRHSIEFGLYYQQRTERTYSAGGASTGNNLWQYMRQLTNSHIALGTTPTFIVNGQTYTMEDVRNNLVSPSPFDTILYQRTANLATQSTFDRNLRSKLGLDPNGTDYVDVDNYDPSTFSLDMFSADELLNNNDGFVAYQGYDYTGKKQKGQVNFNDFFTKRDANGNYTREIGAFRPNYIAGYVLDKFQFKDLLFNVGVRVDRYDANTKVLKDPYSLYDVKHLGDADVRNTVQNKLNGSHPSNIGDDYVVYVNSNESSAPEVVGYRNGDDWYDPYGRLIEDPGTLKTYSGGRDPQPLLVNPNTRITDTTYDPNSSFTDYKPQVNVMPRISFSFPISDVALFYAHYDVMVQRPTNGFVYATPSDYFFLNSNDNAIIQNPNLKPQKMFDYEVGFQQQLSQRSAVTFSAFYKERKDMITVRPYLYAWPKTYYTFGNRDFSTTKGLIVKYDLRRVSGLQLNINYTLQFAEGSGSGTGSGNGGSNNFVSNNGLMSNFITGGVPNLRYSSALDIDSRHNIVATVDYRFFDNEGPVIGNTHFLQNTGVNFIFRARSGEPYTKLAFPAQRTVLGQLNGSRYPWHYGLDLRLDKDFKLAFGKKPVDAAERKALYLNAYVMINNVLNTRDVLSVDGYTGRPDDDGYLTSPQGIQNTKNQTDPQSYVDQYSILVMSPDNINMPRRINLGLQLNF